MTSVKLSEPSIYLENLTNWNDDDLASIFKAAFVQNRCKVPPILQVVRVEHWRGSRNSARVKFVADQRVGVFKLPRPSRFKEDVITRLGRITDTDSDAVTHPFLKHVCYAAHKLLQNIGTHTGYAGRQVDEIDWDGQLVLRSKKNRSKATPASTRAELDHLRSNYRDLEVRMLRMSASMLALEKRVAEELEKSARESE